MMSMINKFVPPKMSILEKPEAFVRVEGSYFPVHSEQKRLIRDLL